VSLNETSFGGGANARAGNEGKLKKFLRIGQDKLSKLECEKQTARWGEQRAWILQINRDSTRRCAKCSMPLKVASQRCEKMEIKACQRDIRQNACLAQALISSHNF
jgi:hypothetical protein